MPQLLILRHGQSEYNKESKFCGWIDVSLTETGKEQAINSATLIKTHKLTRDIPLHLLVTSRLKRAIVTSNLILENIDRLDMDEIKSWRLNERHYGKLQGLKKNDILLKYGKEKFMFWRRQYHGCPPICDDIESEFYKDTLKISKFDDDLIKNPNLIPKAESLEMVINRLRPFWEDIILSNLRNNKNILCVTHGSVVRALLTILYKLSESEVENLNIPNGMPILIDFDENLNVKGKTWTYLEPEKAKIEAEMVKNDGQT